MNTTSIRRPALALAAVVVGLGVAHAALPDVAAAFQALTRSSRWEPVGEIKLQFDTHHPQGMARVGDVFYMSSVQIDEPTQRYPELQNGLDRTPGKGKAHLFKFDAQGRLLADIVLAAGEGDIYHPGGIDFDGRYLYVPVGEYRPNSRSILYRVDTTTDAVTEVLRYNDHLGGVVYEPASRLLHLVSWGSRRWYTWPVGADGRPSAAQPQLRASPSQYVDYQDCHHLEGDLSLCGGVAYLGGHPSKVSFGLGALELVNFKEGRVVHEVPVPLWDPLPASATDATYRAMTTNPFAVRRAGDRLEFAFAPHDGQTSVYLYTVK